MPNDKSSIISLCPQGETNLTLKWCAEIFISIENKKQNPQIN